MTTPEPIATEVASRPGRTFRRILVCAVALLVVTVAVVIFTPRGEASPWPNDVWVVEPVGVLALPAGTRPLGMPVVRAAPGPGEAVPPEWYWSTGTRNGKPWTGLDAMRPRSLLWHLLEELGFDADLDWQNYDRTDETREVERIVWRRYRSWELP